jgi:hypothetical protein
VRRKAVHIKQNSHLANATKIVLDRLSAMTLLMWFSGMNPVEESEFVDQSRFPSECARDTVYHREWLTKIMHDG